MSKLPATHKVATGHRPHMTGAGLHDSRPRRQRARGQQRKAAIRASREGE